MKSLILVFQLVFSFSLPDDPLYQYLRKSYGIFDSVYVGENLVYFGKYKGVDEIVLDSIVSYDRFKLVRAREIIYKNLLERQSEELETASKTASSRGVIPTIQIPVYMPPSFSFLGKEGAKIDIDGTQSVRLSFEKNVTHDPLSYIGKGTSSFFNPQLEQQLRLNLNAFIGSKLSINIDHDSERQDETKNKVIVKFQGEEDDVVKLIELGDTRVTLPSTRFASFPGQTKEGLFGFNSQFQFGPLMVQAIATREKGESQTTSLSRGAVQDSFLLYGKDFEKFRFFYIPESESIVSIQVFVDEQRGIQPGKTIPGFAYFYGFDNSTGTYLPDSALKEYGNFRALTYGEDFIYYPDSKVLELATKAGENYVIAVSYQTNTGRRVGVLVDTILDSLRLVKPSSYPLYIDSLYTRSDTLKAQLWNSMLMNIYDVRVSYITPENIDIQIGRDSSGVIVWGENGRSYLNILGLDENNDGKVDLVRQVGQRTFDILDLNKGILIFPLSRPFIYDSLSSPDSLIYRKTRLSYNEGTKYVIKVIKRQISREIYLNQSNILENSEVVKYNGRVLERGKDYTIDYSLGKIIINDENILRDPNARIDISFDYAPLFSIKDKSLWGMRFEVPLTTGLKVGGSLMGRSESSPVKRPSIGSEPTRSVVGELDLILDTKVSQLTDWFNKISFNKTQAPSTLRIQGEIARSYPDPNTKNFAYIDDMENSKDEVNVSFSVFDWKVGSIPLVSQSQEKDTFYLGQKIVWAGVYDLYKKGQIFTNIPSEEKDLPHLVFYIELYPKTSGIPSFLSISSLLSNYGQDFSNYEFLNVIVKGRKGKLIVNVGPDISENAVWRDKGGRIKSYDPYIISTEDKNGNGVLDEGEDTGLDGVSGVDSLWNPGSSDDGNDDYYNPRGLGVRDYSKINGTEGNGRLDTEELIADGKLSLDNNYYEFVIDLENPSPDIFVGENPEGFRTFLIPLKDTAFVKRFGNPNWGYIRFVRIWFDDVSEPDTVVIAQLKFQGNRYVKSLVMTADSLYPVGSDENIFVRSVGHNDDPNYTSPPGIELERDLITGRLEQENSLGIRYENLGPKHFAHATQMKSTPLNLIDYRTVRFFVKPAPGTSMPYPTVYVRLGDSLNYYEYRYRITSSDWQEVVIQIDSLTQVKKRLRDSTSSPGPHLIGNVAIKGNPSFTQIQGVSFGIINESLERISGEIWIDEFRAGDPRRDRATAGQLNIDFRFANFLSSNLSFTKMQSNFKPLQGAGTKSNDQITFYSINADFGQLLPQKWGLRLNLLHSKNYTYSLPLYGTYSDLILNKTQQMEQRSTSVIRRTSFSFSKSRNSNNLLVKYLVEPFSISGFVNSDTSITPRNIRNGFSRSLSFRHGISVPWTIRRGKIVLNPLPEYNFSGSIGEAKSFYKDLFSNITQKDSSKTFDQSHSIGYNPFSFLNLRYDLGKTNDLQRKQEMSYSEGINGSLRFTLFGILDPTLNFAANYRESKDRSFQAIDSILKANITSSTNAGANVSFNFSNLLSKMSAVLFKDLVDSTGKQIPNPLKKKLTDFSNSIQPLRFNYTIVDNYGLYMVSNRPDWRFRFGIDRNAITDWGQVERFTNSFTRQYSVDWGFRLMMASFNVGGSYNNTINRVYLSKRYTKSVTWPRFSISNVRIGGKYFQKFTSSWTLGFNYQRSEQQSGDFGKLPDNRSFSTSLTQTMNLLFKNGMGLSVNFSRNEQKNTDFRFGERTTKNVDSRLTLNPTYSISQGKVIKLPIGGMRWKLASSLQLGGNFTWSRGVQSSIVGGKETKLRDQTNMSFDLNGTYSITRDITGTIGFGYRKYTDNLSKRYNSNTNFAINVNFNF